GFSATSSSGGENARDGNSLLYTPADGFRGLDSFVYSISDGNGGTDSATVTITVPNAAPEAVNDDLLLPLTIDKAIFDVLANDVDLNGDDLYITDFPSTLPRGSMLLTKYFIQLNREVVIYIPISLDSTDPKAVNGTDPRAVNGTESFSYSISDGNGGTSSATATILIVNAAPEAVNDEVTVQVGTTSTIDVLANDTDTGDFNDDVLSVTGFSAISDQGHPITRDGNSLRYTPAIDFSGTDSFEYSISDGNGGIDSATVTITVEMMT
ncbi:MAG: tandem-95 repeat protein, partial [Hormoscilla sp. GM102CHS1]|nr:tandem-95 repeat protein [Hormoscilla sp. GM102CHS1]